MKIISVILDPQYGLTKIKTDDEQTCDIALEPGNVIPRGVLKKEFNTIEEIKNFCIENQIIEI